MGPRWRSGPWFLRDERLYLVPGDSPMGYRLPLDSLPWVRPADFPHTLEQDHFAERQPLAHAAALKAQFAPHARFTHYNAHAAGGGFAQGGTVAMPTVDRPSKFESAQGLTRTAICVEVRDPARANGPGAELTHEGGKPQGVIYVFMPPLGRLEDYLELLSAVEATAETLGVRVVLEGYAPPSRRTFDRAASDA